MIEFGERCNPWRVYDALVYMRAIWSGGLYQDTFEESLRLGLRERVRPLQNVTEESVDAVRLWR